MARQIPQVKEARARMNSIRAEFAALCRQFGASAIAVHAEIMNNPTASEAARLRASSLLMAYGYGQPSNTLDVTVNKGEEDGESADQKRFRETMERATNAAAQSLRPSVPVLRAPDPTRDTPAPEIYSPCEQTPAELESVASASAAALKEKGPSDTSLALGVAIGASAGKILGD